MNILLVEDQTDSRQGAKPVDCDARPRAVRRSLQREEAERALTTESFPFLILDWVLPGKAGLICVASCGPPDGDEMFILLVTAKADHARPGNGAEAGANDYSDQTD